MENKVKRLIPLLLLAVFASGQEQTQRVFGPFVVETPEGKFDLSDVRLWEYSSLRPGFIGPRPSGLIENRTGTSWEKLILTARISCVGQPAKQVQIFIYGIGASQSVRFRSETSDADNACDAESVEVTFDRGVNLRQAERDDEERRRKAAERAADKTIRVYAIRPLLFKDEGCVRDYLKAQAASGVEKRKALADLVQYGCMEKLSWIYSAEVSKTLRISASKGSPLVKVAAVVVVIDSALTEKAFRQGLHYEASDIAKDGFMLDGDLLRLTNVEIDALIVGGK